MTVQEKENQHSAAEEENDISHQPDAPAAEPTSELDEPKWSVVTFETRAASNLTYRQAAEILEKLTAEKVAGLCIVTDAAAERINEQQ